MNVALLNPVYWPEVRRGSERFARELADGLLARGHRPRIVTSRPGLPAAPRRAVEDGVEVVRVWRPPHRRLDRRLYEQHLTHVPLTYLELRRSDDDVAHALYPTDALAALRWGGPTVLSYMGIPHRASLANRRLRKEIVLKAARGAGAVVALSRAAAQGFARWLGVEARVIPPGVDLTAFTPDPAQRADVPTILCAADHREPRKRVGLLLEAFARVRRERPDARLILSGADAPRAPGVEGRDLDDRAALAAANRQAWVAVLPSWGEAFGLVLVEALACGTPVVGPNAEVIDRPEVGRVFTGDDPGELARALLECLELGDVAGACRERAAGFSTGACAAAYEALYEEVIHAA